MFIVAEVLSDEFIDDHVLVWNFRLGYGFVIEGGEYLTSDFSLE